MAYEPGINQESGGRDLTASVKVSRWILHPVTQAMVWVKGQYVLDKVEGVTPDVLSL